MNSAERNRIFVAIEQLQQASALFSKRRAQLAAAAGLTEAQWRVMEGIATEHFMPSLFAREQDHTGSAVSKLLRQLLDKKLIRVSIAAGDGRQRSYELTGQGRKVMDKLRDLRSAAIEDVWADLPPGELAGFSAFAEKLIGRLREKAAHARIESSPQ
jgi:DNA-binding MarR family transcriptional regulator